MTTEPTNYLQLARDAFSESTTYFDSSIRPQVEAALRQFQGVPAQGPTMNKDPSILLAAPPVAVAAAEKIGEATSWFSVNDFYKWAMAVYVPLLICYVLWKWRRQWLQAREPDGSMQYVQGLHNRRKAEMALCLKP